MVNEVLVPDEVSVLVPFVKAGVLDRTDVHLAATFARTSREVPFEVLLGAALAVRAPRLGHVCVDLTSVASTVVSSFDAPVDPVVVGASGVDDSDYGPTSTLDADTVDSDLLAELSWPDPQAWLAALAASELVATVPSDQSTGNSANPAEVLHPLVLDGDRLYLSRYWYQERYVAADLVYRSNLGSRPVEPPEPQWEPSGEDARESGRSGSSDAMQAAEAHVRRLFSAFAEPGSGSGAVVVDSDPGDGPDDDQLNAALAGLRRDLVVISGGPGTGKTTTVARFLAGLMSGMHEVGSVQRIALAAPTGKAAARMTESISSAVEMLRGQLAPVVVDGLRKIEATTIHRLLGRGIDAEFAHGPKNQLAYDVIIVDEVSMVSLSLMASLLSAIRPDAKVVLVGDPYQLASVEAGVVLGDVVGMSSETHSEPAAFAASSAPTPPSGPGNSSDPVPPAVIGGAVRSLRKVHRQAAGSPVLALADAVRKGEIDDALAILSDDSEEVRWVRLPDGPGGRSGNTSDPKEDPVVSRATLRAVREVVVAAAESVVVSANHGDVDAALAGIGGLKVLCGQRVGPTGVIAWNRMVEESLRSRGLIGRDEFYAGRPVMVTKNDYLNGVFNGDVGVAVAAPDATRNTNGVTGGSGHFQVWFPGHEGNRMIEAARLDHTTTQWAMTIHKSQGSEFPHVIVSLPPAGSRILTRELIYTAVTRAKSRLTLVSSEDSLRVAIGRPVTRSSGLRQRLERAGIDHESLFVSPA